MTRRRVTGIIAAVTTAGTLAVSGLGAWTSASADQTTPVSTPYAHEYPLPDSTDAADYMAVGSDGLPWADTANGSVDRINADGSVTPFSVDPGQPLLALTLGSDGALYTASYQGNSAYRIATDGSVVKSSTTMQGTAYSVAAAPNGTVWYADASAPIVYRFDATGTLTPFTYPLPSGAASDGVSNSDKGIVTDANGDLWLIPSSNSGGELVKMTTAGVATTYGIPDQTQGDVLTIGPNGNPWVFTDGGDIYEFNETSNGFTEKYSTSTEYGVDSVVGADGRVWYLEETSDGTSSLLALSENGGNQTYAIPNPKLYPYNLVKDPNGNVAFTETAIDGANTSEASYVVTVSTSGVASELRTANGTSNAVATAHALWFGGPGYVGTTGSVNVDRVSGADRYATSVALAQAAYGGTTGGTVFVATGTNYPDALAAGPAAAKEHAPLLLTAPTALPQDVSDEIAALAPKRVVVVGGPFAVSDGVMDQIRSAAPGASVTRISGSDRFGTADAIVQDAWPSGTSVTSVDVATGTNFPDALAAAAAAGSEGIPVLLVNGGGSSVDATTNSLIGSLGAHTITVVGGPNAVSPAVASQLQAAHSAAAVTRISGSDRFDTAAKIAANAFPTGASHVYVATGYAFPDALAGSALAAAKGAPLLTATNTCTPEVLNAEVAALGATNVTLIGGTFALSSDVEHLTLCN
ncbi:cell wall-binding repeat-containing protein [Curtobacterium ammoniigenes]|uniref:cell wall-binding repeat-containing protein n=1 Tax=Curtobacterium ammoniigenes TaxID=395387 RepID=UPI000835B8DB|nr:cell wall-binding repeat-containing protein [Curtobacterium ammoniigenes]